jgi:hypothetical protein
MLHKGTGEIEIVGTLRPAHVGEEVRSNLEADINSAIECLSGI